MRATILSIALGAGLVAASATTTAAPTTTKSLTGTVKPTASIPLYDDDEDDEEICESKSTLKSSTKATGFPTHPTGGHGFSTSTIYSTTVYTVTKCPPTVTKCPAESVKVTTEVIVVGTTLCPVSSAPYVPGSKPEVTPAPGSPGAPGAPGSPAVVPTGGVAGSKPTGQPVTAGAGRVAVPAVAAAGLLALLL